MWLFSSKQYSYLVLAIVLCLPFSVLGIIINAVNNGVQNYKKYIGLGMLSVIASTAIMIFLVIYGSVKGALLAISIQSGIIGVVLFICSVKEPWLKISYWVGAIDRDKFLYIFRYILMALISALVFPLALLIIRNTLIDLEGWNVTGQWQAVWKISDAYLSVMTLALSTYYLPLLSKLDNLHDLRREIKSISKVIIPITILLSSVIYFSSGLIVRVLFTEEFKDAESLFLIQLIGDNVKIIAWLYAYPLIAYGIAKWYIIAEISFALLFIFLGRLLISNYGVSGANWAYLLSYVIYFCFVFIVMNKVVIFSRKG
ncbi:O-antigen translocase [Escherichia coli]|nr:O-antigen translocase [Escherichia coli]